MAKAEWGTKRICGECGARYYDMRKDPPTCPKCGTVFEAVSVKAKRKPAAAPVAEDRGAKARKPKVADDLELESKVLETGAEDEEEEEMIEDASELGEDEEDVAEVIETKVEGEEDVERGR
ncbi:MAG: TIGR02300 family protein [Gemmatimonas sp.]